MTCARASSIQIASCLARQAMPAAACQAHPSPCSEHGCPRPQRVRKGAGPGTLRQGCAVGAAAAGDSRAPVAVSSNAGWFVVLTANFFALVFVH